MTAAATDLLERFRPVVEDALESALGLVPAEAGRLKEAMAYSLAAGGKRLRPVLCLASCEAVGGTAERAATPAAAMELIHTYSLIHDDLPCMDDDDLRRGRPTSHRVFGEAGAVLAGDGLLTLAFESLAAEESLSPTVRARMTLALARAAGAAGMVGGQSADLEAEGAPEIDVEQLASIHRRKTGALMGAACELGALAADVAQPTVDLLREFGQTLGLAFQIVDDLLDVEGGAEELGKAAGKDLARGKATYPGLWGVPESRRRALALKESAIEMLSPWGEAADGLRSIADFVADRSS